jgi:hypothetical protein
LIAAAAAFGLAAGIAIATLWFTPAHPGQLPGAMLAYNVDARASMRMMWTIILAPLLGAFLGRPLARYVVRDPRTKAWAPIALGVALLAGLWLAIVDPFDVVVVIFVPLVAVAAIVLARHLDLRLDWWRRRPRRLLGFAVYPLLAIALGIVSDPNVTSGRPLLNLFEDGHSLMPANEMRHGERPYRDIVPIHGLIGDGLLDFAAMSLGAHDAGAVLRFRMPFIVLLPVAVYAVGFAATGSAEAGLLALLAAMCVTIAGTPWSVPVTALRSLPPIRPVPSLFALALCASALRRRRPRLLLWAGVLAVLACFTSIDFGFYAVVALAASAVRLRDWRSATIGIGAAGVLAFLLLAIAGSLPAFFRVMLHEIPPLSEAYSVAIFRFPPAYESLRGFPEILGGLFATRTVWIVTWGLIAIGTAAALAIGRRSRIVDPLLPLGAWVVASALSYGERTNVYFMPVAIAIAVATAYALRRNRTLCAVATLVIVIVAAPSHALFRPVAPRGVAYDGVLLDPDNAEKVAAAQRFIQRTLRPGDTWFDFANMPILYYLFDRDCPVRQYETPLYETEELQREVIARLEANPHVRAALMQFPNRGAVSIDDVPNPVRAPLVFAYLREHFVPAYADRGVVFWVRR